MSKFILTIMAVLVLAGASPSTGHASDFRGSAWGTPMRNQKRVETLTPNLKAVVDVRCTMAGKLCRAFYYFLKGKLAMGMLFLNVSHVNTNLYLDDFDNMVLLLSKKYGEPEQNEHIWRGDLFRETPQYWGTAVQRGDLVRMALWRTDRTEVRLGLQGDGRHCRLHLEYVDVTAKEAMGAEFSSLQLKDL